MRFRRICDVRQRVEWEVGLWLTDEIRPKMALFGANEKS
jgi:hypothetical protein